MRQFRNCSAHGRIIGPFHNLIQLRQTETANHLLVRFRRSNKAALVLNTNLAAGRLFLFLCSLLCHEKPRESSIAHRGESLFYSRFTIYDLLLLDFFDLFATQPC